MKVYPVIKLSMTICTCTCEQECVHAEVGLSRYDCVHFEVCVLEYVCECLDHSV